MLLHKKIGKWLPPGGHLEENETPQMTALREVFEETGLEIELIDSTPFTITTKNASTLYHPLFTLLEEIPTYKNIAPHQHIDHIFAARLKNGNLHHNSDESFAVQWFSKEAILNLSSELCYDETKEIALYILEAFTMAVK